MIVISGALVVVALILLVIGLASGTLAFVYASIGVSVLSFVSLLIGVLQRRREGAPATDGAAAPVATTTATQAADDSVAPVRRASGGAVASGSVLVVEGRPRYHVAGCRYLTGKTAESLDVSTAAEQGFTSCGVCKPDEALASAGSTEASAETTEGTESNEAAQTTALPVDTSAAEDIAPARVTRAAKPATRTAATASTRSSAPAKQAAAKAAPGKKAATKAPAKKAAVKAAAVTTPAKTAAKKAPAKPAAAKQAPVKKGPAKAAPAKTAAKKAPAKKAPAKKAATRR